MYFNKFTIFTVLTAFLISLATVSTIYDLDIMIPSTSLLLALFSLKFMDKNMAKVENLDFSKFLTEIFRSVLELFSISIALVYLNPGINAVVLVLSLFFIFRLITDIENTYFNKIRKPYFSTRTRNSLLVISLILTPINSYILLYGLIIISIIFIYDILSILMDILRKNNFSDSDYI